MTSRHERNEEKADHLPFVYNTDCGNKQTLATSVAHSDMRYAILRSMAPRFADHSNDVPFASYNTDTGFRKSMETSSRDSRMFYAASFQSKTPRFGRAMSQPLVDEIYEVKTLSNSKPSTVSHSVDTTSIKYAIHHSKMKRFDDKPLSDAPDVTYEVDYGIKESLHTSMKNSPIGYRNVSLGTKRGDKLFMSDTYKAALGPGSYDYPYHADWGRPPLLENLPLSSMVSRSERFKEGKTGMGMGSTYRPEVEAKKWHTTAQSISKAEYLRPQYMPKTFLKQQTEVSMQLRAKAKA